MAIERARKGGYGHRERRKGGHDRWPESALQGLRVRTGGGLAVLLHQRRKRQSPADLELPDRVTFRSVRGQAGLQIDPGAEHAVRNRRGVRLHSHPGRERVGSELVERKQDVRLSEEIIAEVACQRRKFAAIDRAIVVGIGLKRWLQFMRRRRRRHEAAKKTPQKEGERRSTGGQWDAKKTPRGTDGAYDAALKSQRVSTMCVCGFWCGGSGKGCHE